MWDAVMRYVIGLAHAFDLPDWHVRAGHEPRHFITAV
jgi:hypothetical protein